MKDQVRPSHWPTATFLLCWCDFFIITNPFFKITIFKIELLIIDTKEREILMIITTEHILQSSFHNILWQIHSWHQLNIHFSIKEKCMYLYSFSLFIQVNLSIRCTRYLWKTLTDLIIIHLQLIFFLCENQYNPVNMTSSIIPNFFIHPPFLIGLFPQNVLVVCIFRNSHYVVLLCYVILMFNSSRCFSYRLAILLHKHMLINNSQWSAPCCVRVLKVGNCFVEQNIFKDNTE